MANKVKVAVIQCGPCSDEKEVNIATNLDLLDKVVKGEPNIVAYSELSTTKYWCGLKERSFFKLAESIPGPTTEIFSKKAREYGIYILLPIFEKSGNSYYNSAVLLDPQGEVVEGSVRKDEKVISYRKCHLPSLDYGEVIMDEKYYFKPGAGIPTFKCKFGEVGILLCYDRSFPEAWRTLSIKGASVVFVPTASWGWRDELFVQELRIRALENGLFVVAPSKGGREVMERERIFFGSSCIIDPMGNVLNQGPGHSGPSIIHAELDLEILDKARQRLPLLKDRRPEIYQRLGFEA